MGTIFQEIADGFNAYQQGQDHRRQLQAWQTEQDRLKMDRARADEELARQKLRDSLAYERMYSEPTIVPDYNPPIDSGATPYEYPELTKETFITPSIPSMADTAQKSYSDVPAMPNIREDFASNPYGYPVMTRPVPVATSADYPAPAFDGGGNFDAGRTPYNLPEISKPAPPYVAPVPVPALAETGKGAPPPIPATPPPVMSWYTVRKGDSLSKIAQHFGVPLQTIINVNRIKNPDVIDIGQKISLPLKGNAGENVMVWGKGNPAPPPLKGGIVPGKIDVQAGKPIVLPAPSSVADAPMLPDPPLPVTNWVTPQSTPDFPAIGGNTASQESQPTVPPYYPPIEQTSGGYPYPQYNGSSKDYPVVTPPTVDLSKENEFVRGLMEELKQGGFAPTPADIQWAKGLYSSINPIPEQLYDVPIGGKIYQLPLQDAIDATKGKLADPSQGEMALVPVFNPTSGETSWVPSPPDRMSQAYRAYSSSVTDSGRLGMSGDRLSLDKAEMILLNGGRIDANVLRDNPDLAPYLNFDLPMIQQKMYSMDLKNEVDYYSSVFDRSMDKLNYREKELALRMKQIEDSYAPMTAQMQAEILSNKAKLGQEQLRLERAKTVPVTDTSATLYMWGAADWLAKYGYNISVRGDMTNEQWAWTIKTANVIQGVDSVPGTALTPFQQAQKDAGL